jgi:hypothetical protein
VLLRWSEFAFLLMTIAPQLASHRKIKINGVTYTVTFGENLPKEELLYKLYYVIPDNVSRSVLHNLGSEKLEVPLGEPLSSAPSGEELPIVSFFRTLLYTDLKLPRSTEKLRWLIQQIESSPYLMQVLLQRLKQRYRLSPAKEVDGLRKVIVELIPRVLGQSAHDSTQEVSKTIERLNRELLLVEHHRRHEE